MSSKNLGKKVPKISPKIDTFPIAIVKKISIIISVKGMGQAPRTEPKGEHVNHGKSCKGEWDTGLKSSRTN
jgi:hypothetical protein